jgi:hypothetical protein
LPAAGVVQAINHVAGAEVDGTVGNDETSHGSPEIVRPPVGCPVRVHGIKAIAAGEIDDLMAHHWLVLNGASQRERVLPARAAGRGSESVQGVAAASDVDTFAVCGYHRN